MVIGHGHKNTPIGSFGLQMVLAELLIGLPETLLGQSQQISKKPLVDTGKMTKQSE